jgi:hypothetical protein
MYFNPRIDAPQMLAAGGLPAFLVGSCAFPLTYRALADRLARLPDDMRADLAESLTCGDTTAIRWSLVSLEDPRWDDEAPAWLGIDIASGTRKGMLEDVGRILDAWCQDEGAPDKRRVATATLDRYLAVWDAREGFADGRYDHTAEKRFRDAAVSLRANIPTLQTRYRSAFRYIIGHEYSPELWTTLFVPLKMPSRWKTWRRSKPRSKSVAPAEQTPSGQADAQCRDDFRGATELQEDIQTLIRRGDTDEQIIAKLELTSGQARQLIAWFRGRREDGI